MIDLLYSLLKIWNESRMDQSDKSLYWQLLRSFLTTYLDIELILVEMQ